MSGRRTSWYSVSVTQEVEGGRETRTTSWFGSSGTLLHREDGPAYTKEAKVNGMAIEEGYFYHGVRHRSDGPARTIFMGPYTRLEWYLNGHLHCETGPSILLLKEGLNRPIIEEWFKDGVRFRQGDYPARIERSESSGFVIVEKYFLNGLEGRVDGPSDETPMAQPSLM